MEMGEIEAGLRGCEGVKEAVVVAEVDERGEKRLIGYVAGVVEERELRERLKQRLPEYMVPGAIVVMERMPLLPNGKIDRKSLPRVEEGRRREKVREARGPIEEGVKEIWEEVLGRKGIG